MGLPRYIINYDDSKVFINEALASSKSQVKLDIDMSNVTKAFLDTTVIESKSVVLNDINLIINEQFDLLSAHYIGMSKYILEETISMSSIYDTFNLSMTELLEQEKAITASLESILDQISPMGEQRSQGFYEYVPPLQKDYEITLTEDTDILLTSITFSQIGWKLQDTYSLKIGDRFVLNTVSTKEIAEKKKLTHHERVLANVPVTFILHNNSGNSRQIFVDLDYIKIV